MPSRTRRAPQCGQRRVASTLSLQVQRISGLSPISRLSSRYASPTDLSHRLAAADFTARSSRNSSSSGPASRT